MGAGMNESVLGKLCRRLAGEGQALCAWVTMNEPAVAECLAREAFDAVVLDMQHGADRLRRRHAFDPPRRACRQTDDRSRADRRICPGQPAHGLRRLRNPRADDRQRRGCATLGRVRQVPAARPALLGPARRAAAQRPGRSRLSQGGQRDDPGDRDDRDPRRPGRARRHSERRRLGWRVRRPIGSFDRLERTGRASSRVARRS